MNVEYAAATFATRLHADVQHGQIIRVAKNKAIVSIAQGISNGPPRFDGQPSSDTGGVIVNSTEDVIRFFRPSVGKVYIRLEPEPASFNGILTIFEVSKSNPRVRGNDGIQ